MFFFVSMDPHSHHRSAGFRHTELAPHFKAQSPARKLAAARRFLLLLGLVVVGSVFYWAGHKAWHDGSEAIVRGQILAQGQQISGAAQVRMTEIPEDRSPTLAELRAEGYLHTIPKDWRDPSVAPRKPRPSGRG